VSDIECVRKNQRNKHTKIKYCAEILTEYDSVSSSSSSTNWLGSFDHNSTL